MGRRRLGNLSDVVLASVLALLGVLEAAVGFSTVMGQGSPLLAGSVAGVTALGLLVRRRYPLAVLVVVMLPWALLSLLVPVLVLFWGGLAPITVAVYSVARYGGGRMPLIGAGVAVGLMLVFNIGTGMIREPGELFFPWLVLVVAWLAGWVIQRKEVAAVAAERRAIDVEAESREQTLVAIAEERTRIARELHDIVTHSVTAIVVQAGAARQVVEDDPAYVQDSLDRIWQTGCDALEEMRRVVTLLRESGDDQLLGPQPGLADLEPLVQRARTARTQVRLQVEGEPRPLPVGADLAAYRIVQEALTNVHRHADATEATVTVRYGPASLELDVCDNGIGQSAPVNGSRLRGSGHGLVGMRERASMYGGQVQVTAAPGAGFQVRVVLPLEDAS